MTREIHCKKLGKKAKGLDFPPYPGELGQKIYESISEEAWQQWIKHQTILINEYRLNMTDPKAREFLRTEMEQFLFSDKEVNKPEAYTPPDEQ